MVTVPEVQAARAEAARAAQTLDRVDALVSSGQFAAALAEASGTSLAVGSGSALAGPGAGAQDTGAQGTGAQGTGSLSEPGAAFGARAEVSAPLAGWQVLADARRYLGVPYQWGGDSPATGFDCSGLVQRVFADLGVSLPRVSQEQAQVGTPVADLAAAEPGDLVFFDPGPGGPGHVGIYAGNGMMIDAAHAGTVVRLEPVFGPPAAIRRVVDPGPVGQDPAASTYAPAAYAPAAYAPAAGAPAAYAPMFAAAGARTGIPATVLAAVARVESGFNPAAVSPAGAEGMMQLMPQTVAGTGVDPFDPAQAVEQAATMLAGLRSRFGSLPLALAAYNAGAGAVAGYAGIPPYPETQAYVRQVLSDAGMAP